MTVDELRAQRKEERAKQRADAHAQLDKLLDAQDRQEELHMTIIEREVEGDTKH